MVMLRRRRSIETVSGKCNQEHIHGMHQFVPSGLDNLLVPLQLQIVVFFKSLDAPLEFGKEAAQVCEFPVVLKLHTDLLFCEAAFQQSDLGGQILDFSQDPVQVSFLEFHDLSPEQGWRWTRCPTFEVVGHLRSQKELSARE